MRERRTRREEHICRHDDDAEGRKGPEHPRPHGAGREEHRTQHDPRDTEDRKGTDRSGRSTATPTSTISPPNANKAPTTADIRLVVAIDGADLRILAGGRRSKAPGSHAFTRSTMTCLFPFGRLLLT